MDIIKFITILIFNLLFAFLVWKSFDGNFIMIYVCGGGALGWSCAIDYFFDIKLKGD